MHQDILTASEVGQDSGVEGGDLGTIKDFITPDTFVAMALLGMRPDLWLYGNSKPRYQYSWTTGYWRRVR